MIEELLARNSNSSPTLNLKDLCFDKQLAFIQDESLFCTAVTSRRAGKTTACAMHLLSTALKHPKGISFYITYARTDAKGIIWPMLHQLNRELSLGGEANEADLIFKFPNGSYIRVSGAATPKEIDRFRGFSIRLAYVDEAQRFGNYISNLIDDVLVPACFDTKGKIRLIGTPGPVPTGYFHDAAESTQSKWSKHAWTMFDNPFLEKSRGESAHEILRQELERKGVTESDPTIQREIFGRWVADTKSLVIDYDATRNHYDTMPPDKYYHVMGIDLGFKDADAIVVLAYGDRSPVTYLVEESINTKQGLTELVRQVERLRDKYEAHKIMIDTGGLGLKLAEEMRRRYGIPVIAAEKQRKFETIEILNDSLRNARFKARRDSRFSSDSMLLQWDLDKLRPDRKVVSDRFHSDVIDATLYAFKESPAYSYRPTVQGPRPGTPEWGRKQEEEMLKYEEEKAKDMMFEEQEQLFL